MCYFWLNSSLLGWLSIFEVSREPWILAGPVHGWTTRSSLSISFPKHAWNLCILPTPFPVLPPSTQATMLSRAKYIQASSASPSIPRLHMSCVTASHWRPLKALHAFSWHWKQNPDSSPGYRHCWVLSNTWTVLSDLTHHVFSHVFLTGRLAPSCCFPQACFLPLFQSLSPSVSPCFSLLYNISSLQTSVAFCLSSSCSKPVSSISNKSLGLPMWC